MVKLIKLITNDEIISEVEEHPNEVFVKNPTILGINSQTSQPILMLYSPLSEDPNGLRISRNHILFITTVRSEITNSYNKMFGGVIQANEGDLNKMSRKLFI